MIMPKTMRGRHFTLFPKIQRSSRCHRNPVLASSISSISSASSLSLLFRWSQISLSAQFANKSEEKSQKNVQPLSAFFQGAVGLSEKRENYAVKPERDNEDGKLKERLRKLEEHVRSLKEETRDDGKNLNSPSKDGNSGEEIAAKQSLWALFADEKKELKLVDPTNLREKDPVVPKALSPDMELFAHHLYLKGYLKDASFIRKNKFDSTVFVDSYTRGFLKFAAVRFGEDHPEIAKWLSASDLKKVALFGCPSTYRRSAYGAKYLRGFFQIEEHEVCQKCILKKLCKHANQKPQRDSSKLTLATVIRVLIAYALEPVPRQLAVPEEIKDSVNRLLKEIRKLSENGRTQCMRQLTGRIEHLV